MAFRKLFQFKIRTLLTLMLVTSILLVLGLRHWQRSQRQKSLMKQLALCEKVGANYSFQQEKEPFLPDSFIPFRFYDPNIPAPTGLLTDILGVDGVYSVVNVSAGSLPEPLIQLFELGEIRSLNLDGAAITNLHGLEHLQKLETLFLSDSTYPDLMTISDLTPLKNCRHLKNLDLCQTDVTNLSPLSNLVKLERLNLENTSVTDIRPLEKLVQLTGLNLWNCKIDDLSTLSRFTKLEILELHLSPNNDPSCLKDLRELKNLSLRGTPIEDLSFLKDKPKLVNLGMTTKGVVDLNILQSSVKLEHLSVRGEVQDLTPLKNFPMLTNLYIDNCKAVDLTPLSKLKNLKSVGGNFSNPPSTLSQVDFGNTKTVSLSGVKADNLPRLPTTLETLRLTDCDLRGFSFAENLPSLRCLKLSGSKIDDLPDLSKTPRLRDLNLAGTDVDDIREISKLTQLNYLSLENNSKLTNFKPLLSMNNCSGLNLNGTLIDDLTCIPKLGGDYSGLSLSRTRATDLAGITGRSYDWLDLSKTKITDFSPMKKIAVFRELNLSGTAIKNLSLLCPYSDSLRLSNTPISDLAPLETWTSLKRIHIDGTSVSKQEIERFQKARPDVEVNK